MESPLAVIQIDEENCFGRAEWTAVRKAMLEELPLLAPTTAWKHSIPSEVEQPDVQPQYKNRGAEQGDSLGPIEASAVIAKGAREARNEVHQLQAVGTLPWFADSEATPAPDDQESPSAHRRAKVAEHEARAPHQKLLLAEPLKHVHPDHEVRKAGGMVDVWYLDDGTIMLHPIFVCPYLRAFDSLKARTGGRRNLAKTKVTVYAKEDVIASKSAEWDLDGVRNLANLVPVSENGRPWEWRSATPSRGRSKWPSRPPSRSESTMP